MIQIFPGCLVYDNSRQTRYCRFFLLQICLAKLINVSFLIFIDSVVTVVKCPELNTTHAQFSRSVFFVFCMLFKYLLSYTLISKLVIGGGYLLSILNCHFLCACVLISQWFSHTYGTCRNLFLQLGLLSHSVEKKKLLCFWHFLLYVIMQFNNFVVFNKFGHLAIAN